MDTHALGSHGQAGRFLVPAPRPRSRIAEHYRWLAAALLGLVALRMLFPYVLCWAANLLLGIGGTYRGHVADISLDLWRGACRVQGLEVGAQTEDAGLQPLFAIERVDLALDWEQVWRGRLRVLVDAQRSRLTFDQPSSGTAPAAADGRLVATGR